MNLSDLHNPKGIEGLLLWNNGNPVEIAKEDNQAFQEYPKSIELWQIDKGLLRRIKRWRKKSITHFVVNNQFILKD